jgi:hypothetical protein
MYDSSRRWTGVAYLFLSGACGAILAAIVWFQGIDGILTSGYSAYWLATETILGAAVGVVLLSPRLLTRWSIAVMVGAATLQVALELPFLIDVFIPDEFVAGGKAHMGLVFLASHVLLLVGVVRLVGPKLIQPPTGPARRSS